ncbi:transglycosylase SLT domain-containing protein [Geodermatophilus normandii]|uniref:Lytic transglycosylase domain-containing protein n=1 Tax=Geodermatophilus normandii TaxID=1137989 RepID=A0A6P0GD77_9ACTN|nr:transglycosylase SLT domain-containing protein [Geodermatophilus normandii]NEM04647.1 lytic transglycosylase domain-containing protein [Geodermatophilus normandii]
MSRRTPSAPATAELAATPDTTSAETASAATRELRAVDATTGTAEVPAPRARRRLRRGTPPLGPRRPALLLGAAAAGALIVGVVSTTGPAASAGTGTDTVSASVGVAEQLGIPQQPAAGQTPQPADLAPLVDLAASRSERSAEEASAASAQAAADQAELDRRAAEEAARIAAEQEAARVAAEQEAARVAAEQEAARQAAEAAEAAEAQAAAEAAAAERAASQAAAPPAASSSTSSSSASRGSFKDYAMSKVGSAAQFTCLENLWGKESGWNPTAQNPTSTAYGIAQFLDSTWAGTGIAKTSDGYRQIDAGLIYIEERYGSPCAAWAHSQANNWY